MRKSACNCNLALILYDPDPIVFLGARAVKMESLPIITRSMVTLEFSQDMTLHGPLIALRILNCLMTFYFKRITNHKSIRIKVFESSSVIFTYLQSF